MKKSFSILLSAAVAFGSFASLTSAAELTAKEKFDALKAKGIFTGINAAGDAGLDQNMNRAQFARVAALILGLEGIGNPDTLKVTEKPFPDVNLGKWYTEEVAAVKAAKVLVGNADGTFNPEGNISVQELAVVTANLLGLKAVEGAKVDGAADWAAPYVKAILDAGVSFPTNYTEAATRGQLVEISFQADAKINPVAPAKVSVASAKATGVKTVEVKLDKAVDDTKATLTLKRGTATVATTAKWSDDKKTATLTLTSTKISAADYSVTLAGIAAEEIATASASFKGEDEKITKLEFVTASDEIAYTTAARVRLKAENQYGEIASANSANFTVNADASLLPSISKDSDGYLIVKLDTTKLTGGVQGMSMVPIYVFDNVNHLTASKTFKLGFAPFITKSELSAVKYDNGKTALINSGDTATAELKMFDQYGNPFTIDQIPGGLAGATAPAFNWNVAPYAQDVTVTRGDFDFDNEIDVRIALTKKADKAQSHSLTVFTGSSNANTTFEVGTSKVATKIEFDSFDGTLATGDTGKYVSFTAYDANGDKLTAQEIADNAKIVAPATSGRFTLTASGVSTASIVTVGPNKGKIALGTVNAPKNSYVFLTLSILSPNANDVKTLQIPVADVRVPASLAVGTAPAPKAVLGADSKFVIVAKDQYGDTFAQNGSSITGTSDQYRIKYDSVAGTSSISVTGTLATAMNTSATTQDFDNADSDYYFDTTAGVFGTASLKATLQKWDTTSSSWRDVAAPVTVAIESIDPSKTELNYSIGNIDSLYASSDNVSLFPAAATATSVSGSVYVTTSSNTAKSISLTVKDNAGNSVAYPDSIRDVTTSDNLIAQVSGTGTTAKVVGNKAGEATVTAVVYKANGETVTLISKVTVKNDPVVAASVSADGSKDMSAITVLGADAGALMGVNFKDNYGIDYNAGNIQTYAKLTGVRYTVSELSGCTVTVDPTTGLITAFSATASKYQFVVTATAPNGKSASTVFYN